MTQIIANHPAPEVTALRNADWEHRLAQIAADPRMSEDNITLTGASAKRFAMPMFFVGIVGLVITIVGAFSVDLTHALGAFEIGVFTALAVSLGSLFWVMVFHSLNASWSITLRRQFENLAAIVWLPVLMMILVAAIELFRGGVLLDWLGAHDEYNHLLEVKAPYLNPTFFIVRIVIYSVSWIAISRALLAWSRKGDETGDRRYGRKARRLSGFAIPVFAFTCTFAAFDFLMSLDYRYFSTMWGVYYFATCGLASASAVAVMAYLLRKAGKLEGLVTDEHFHDLGKLVFTFVIFWAYIAFAQYFLTWYSNIPEETSWYFNRQAHGYQWLFIVLISGHFILPFLLLIWRKAKRQMGLLCLMSCYMLLMVVMDMVWIIRPMVDMHPSGGVNAGGISGVGTIWLDIAGVVGVMGLFAGVAAMKAARSPLLPIKDPMLHESMRHKNYV